MIVRVAVIGFALAAALIPLPASFVERQYSRGVYLLLQPALTSASNVLPFGVIDVFLLATLGVGLAVLVRRGRRDGAWSAVRRTAASAVVLAAVVYLVFLATWGLNYRRVPLEEKVDYAADRVSRDAAIRFATVVVQSANAHYPVPRDAAVSMSALEDAFADTQQLFGGGRLAAPGRPKWSMLQPYFRWTAISGMTVPGPLEIILNPDLLAVEVPFTLTHEWAHLAGYADESEANFLAWLTCVRSPDPQVRYSGWLESYGLAMQAIPRDARKAVPPLADGPRQDLQAIYARFNRSSPVARTAARNVYDSYLKVHRVEEGIRSYDAALRLILGTKFDEGWKPVLR